MNDRKSKIRAALAKYAAITIECEPEESSLHGNVLASGDDAEDEAAEREVAAQLTRGNQWAWCCVIVRAEWCGLVEFDSLGCCSYENEAAFKVDGYYDDMVEHALDLLAARVAEIADMTEMLLAGGAS